MEETSRRVEATGRSVARGGKSVARGLARDATEVARDVQSGQDGLGSIVRVVAKKHERADQVLHCLNGVGFEWADRRRVPIMLSLVVLGLGVSATSLCGAQGMGPHALDSLPWAQFDDSPLLLADVQWWICQAAVDDPNCTAALVDASNTALWTNLQPLCPGDPSCSTAFADGSWVDLQIGTNDWNLNQWGLCIFPKHQWVLDAIDGATWPTSGITKHPNGGSCRKWSELDTGDDSMDGCKNNAADYFTLIMGAFGGFMKIFEPLSRLKRSTDNHQKTIVLLIIFFSSIPPLLAIIIFNSSCVESLTSDFSSVMGGAAKFGPGAVCFSVSVGLMAPIAILHVIVPSGVTTARTVDASVHPAS